MGGTGSYDPYRPDPSGPTGDPEPGCLDLKFTATIQVPAEPVDVERNAVLEVVRTNVGEGALIVGVLDAGGVLVGSIIDELDRLLPCLSQGVAFIGEVIVVNYGVPSVRISAASIPRVEGRAVLQRVSGELAAPVGDVSVRLDGGTDATLASMVVAVCDGRVIGDVDHARQSELRALLRVGVAFSVELSDGDTVTISHRQ
jgi:hypothetical protein